MTKFNVIQPELKNVDVIKGNRLIFVPVNEEDAKFILDLRLSSKGTYLSKTANDLFLQKEFITKSISDHNQQYFIIKNEENESIGTIRLYDPIDNSICWGSWIIKDGVRKSYSIESALILYNYAFYCGFYNAHIDVRKKNRSVISFHEKFGAKLIKETKEDNYYQLEFYTILQSLKKYEKFLPNGITIN